MPLFHLIFAVAFIALWMLIGMLPWLASSIRSRGNAGMVFLPVCMLAGVAGGLLVPFLGLTGAGGVWLSLLAALLVPTMLVVARHVSLGTIEHERRRTEARVRAETE